MEVLSLSNNEILAAITDSLAAHADETILFWHRGLPTSDIALGMVLLDKARSRGIGTELDYA